MSTHSRFLAADPQVACRELGLPLPAFVLDGLLTESECKALVRAAESAGIVQTSGAYPASYRDNDRLMLHDAALADRLWQRVRAFAPRRGPWVPCGLNPRFRVCRYSGGQAFRVHRDGPWCEEDGRRSLMTVQVYLNPATVFEGGHTRFFSDRSAEDILLALRPLTGTAAMFDHRLWHDGEPVSRGTKYVLRTDVMFRCEAGVPQDTHRGYVWRVAAGGGVLWSLGRDRTLRAWRDGRCVSTQRGPDTSLTALTYAEGPVSGCRDGRVVRAGAPPVTVHEGAVLDLGIASGAIVSCGADGRVNWLGEDLEVLATATVGGWLWRLAPVEGGVVVGSEAGRLVLCRRSGSSQLLLQHAQAITAVVEHAGSVVFGDAEGGVYEVLSGRAHLLGRHRGRVRALVSTPLGIVGGGEDDCVRLHDGADGRLLRRHADFVSDVAFAEGLLASASYDGSVRVGSLESTTGSRDLMRRSAASAA